MSTHNREENDRILRLSLWRYSREESGGLPNAEELQNIRFSADYALRRAEIIRCGGRPEQAGASRNEAVLAESFAAYEQEENALPPASALDGVTFTKAYEKRKKQILRAKGRPADIHIVRGKRARRVLRVGIVAALIAVIAMTGVFSNPNGEKNLAGFDIKIDSYFGTIDAPTNPDGTQALDEYIEQPDGTMVLPQQYAPTYIPADYPLEDYQCDWAEYYIFRKDNASLFYPGDYITFYQEYPGGTHIFNLEDFTLEEIEVEGLGNCLYHAEKKGEVKSLTWKNSSYIFQVSVSNLSKDELIKIAISTKLKQN